MPRIRVLIVDDHALVRAGVRAMLSAEPDLEVVGEASDGVSVIDSCRRLTPQIVLMDLSMPGRGGIVATRELRQSLPGIKVVVVTIHEDQGYVLQALEAGAVGCVFKRTIADELVTAIRQVSRGRIYLPRQFDPDAGGAPGGRKGADDQCRNDDRSLI
jgi:two-component system response regulator NreC